MSDPMREVLAELLRLYDWRFELAEEEQDLRNLSNVVDVVYWRALQKELRAKLNQYGSEKKAAWQRAREVLSR